jgi:serine/threonine protein kinase/tetratricopeptide (TPR) repeat protein
MSHDQTTFQPGNILAGRYQVRRELGRGGMGVVYLCRDLVHDERVAVKLLSRPGMAPSAEDAWWFQEEARALAGLSHPAIVRARDFGTLGDGTPYLAMDAVPGRSLHEWIYLAHTEGLLPWPIVWTTIDQVLAALAHAHARGVVHGDLKPSNILLDVPEHGDPQVHVLDLGLAWLLKDRVDHRLDGGSEAEPTVRFGAGTPGWMAPEQIRFATPHIGAPTDLYALGCILFALLSDREPYVGSNEELLAQHRNAPVPSPGLPPGVPKEVGPFVVRLMQKRPWHRFIYASDARRTWRLYKPAGSASETPLPLRPSDRPSIVPTREEITLPEPHFLAGHPHPGAERALERPSAVAAGLLALRPSPFVARQHERAHLLELVHAIGETHAGFMAMRGAGRPKSAPRRHFVMLDGEAGVGKSRLAEWLVEEIHERAIMTPLRARYRKLAAVNDGVVGAVMQHYRLEKAERDVVEKVLMNHWNVGPEDDDGTTWVAAAAEWMKPEAPTSKVVGPTGKRFALDRPELRWLVVRRVLERLGSERPILLWMDDLHLAPPTTFEGLVRVFKDSVGLSLLVIATARAEALEADPQTAERLDKLVAELDGERLVVPPLEAAHTHALLRETLPLDDAAVLEAAARSKGNPLFALQIVHAWAMGGTLRMREGRYVVPKESLVARPSTTAELWEERLISLPQEHRGAALAASALGGEIRRDVLKTLLEILGHDAAKAIPAIKRSQILLGFGSDRFRWPHMLLQEHLLSRLFQLPEAARVFRAAADALAQHPSAGSRRVVRHRVVNLLRAGAPVEAADLLHGFIAANWWRSRDTAATLRDLALLDGRLEGRQSAVQHLWRGEALRHAGRLDEARKEAEAARQAFQDLGDRRSEATCLRLLGHIASDQAAPAQGRRLVARGLAIFEDLGDVHGAAQCEVTLGEIDYLLGDHSRARDILASAAKRFQGVGDRLGHAQSIVLLCLIEQAGGSPAWVREMLLVARGEFEAIGYRLGLAQCDVGLAHTDHRDGQMERARTTILGARQAFRDLANPRGEAACERLLTMIAMDQEQLEPAEQHADAAEALFDRLADPWGQVEVRLLRSQIALSRGDAEVARDELIACEAVALVEAEPKQHRHLTRAWLAYHEGRFVEAGRELDAARTAFKDASRTGDHTPALLDRFATMEWPKPAGPKIEAWRTAIAAQAKRAAVA